MHPALARLILFQGKGLARWAVRGARSPRGIVFLVLALTLLTLWLVRGISQAYLAERFPPERARTAFPLALLGICGVNLITSLGERAVAFLPAEVDFLFAGPFSRRQLLGYKLLKSGFGALFTASIFSLVFVRYSQRWAAGWLGIFLALLFQHLFTMSVVLIGQTIGERAYTRGRTTILVVLTALGALAVAPLLFSGGVPPVAEVVAAFRTSTFGRALLAPFGVFAQIVVAPALIPDAIPWVALAAAMIALLTLVVMWLDAHYLEASAAAGQRLYDRVRRARRGLAPLRAYHGPRWRLPRPPRFGGAGPIAWRQLTTAVRQSRALVLRLVVVCLAFVAIVETGGFGENSGSVTGIVTGALFWLTFMFSSMLPFDFRGDVDHIDVLKALPLSPAALCGAQLVAPVAVMTICQLSLLAVLSLLLTPPSWLIAAAITFLVPFDLLLIAVENLIFLVFPVRLNPVSPGDLEGWGRQMLVFVLKMLSLTILCGVALGVGFLVFAAGGSTSPVTLAATTVTVMLIEAGGFVPVLARAFRRFDPSLNVY